MKATYAPGEDPEFDVIFQPSVTGFVHGQIRPEVWRALISRSVVPVVISMPTKMLRAHASRQLTNFASISGIRESAEELRLPSSHYAVLKFRIDWQSLMPDEIKRRIDSDTEFASAWRSLPYQAACNLLTPLRRVKSPASIQRELSALIKAVERLQRDQDRPC